MDQDELKALVIEMRVYILSHDGRMGGECVAWEKLKKFVGVAQSTEQQFREEDVFWLIKRRSAEASAQ